MEKPIKEQINVLDNSYLITLTFWVVTCLNTHCIKLTFIALTSYVILHTDDGQIIALNWMKGFILLLRWVVQKALKENKEYLKIVL